MIDSPRWPFCAVPECRTRIGTVPICGDHLRLLPEPLRAELAEAVRSSAYLNGAGRNGKMLIPRCVDAIQERTAVRREGP